MTPLTTAPRQAIVVVGLGYGDESKGATVDYLASTIDDTVAVVRWSGGAQAAHNVRHGPRHHTFRQFGSATFLGVPTILRAPMLVNPLLLNAEAAELETKGVADPLGLITADATCLVTTPIHAAMNRAREILRGTARHGSTGLGIGETVAYDLAIQQLAKRSELIGNFPCPADAPAVPALRLGDLADRTTTTAALDALATYARPLLNLVDDADARHPSVAEMTDELMTVAREIRIVDDIDAAISEALDAGTVIFEGSQGLLLDEWHGFHPHTTWATVTPRHLVAGLTAAGHRPYVLGLTRTYATRHGHGPMPTEDGTLELPEPDNGPGLYQGSWRTGHLDLPALRYAAKVAGRIDGVGVSHLDALAHGGLCVARTWDGDPDPLPLPTGQDLNQLDALTVTASSAHPSLEPLPHNDHEVLALISEAVGAPVVLTSDGPSRLDRRLMAFV
ncbi:adenylosuccinate synthetase [Tessaracoccus caeni]|uniref:adenylosuccinate synthetase n=1 Tax=Tessaracoccus caeni TaxID=3031239 RepID=UPI0023DAB327|nr:adenylosuccinate synthetase [Tessaracoccus caeni]MDF1487450.1 adenylosuccinate synthetase [Tessaracoccus caeni]